MDKSIKKVILVIDHKERDLRGIVLISYWLNTEYGVKVYISTTKNEISGLIKYKPDLIIIQHVRHYHQKEFLEFAKHRGIKIALLMAEGFPSFPDRILMGVGKDEFLHYIDLLFPWGPELISNYNRSKLRRDVQIEIIGSPRFDYHTPIFSSLSINKEDFCSTIGFDKNKKIVLWMTNMKYANPEEGFKKLVEFIKDPNSSDHRLAPVIESKAKDHQLCYDVVSDYFLNLAKDFLDVNFIIKVHPAENINAYKTKFGKLKNVKIVFSLNGFTLTDLIRYADIQLTRWCTTSVEAWLTDIAKNVIGIEIDDLNLREFEYLRNGCDLVKTYDELKERVRYYIQGGLTSTTLLSDREKFIKGFLVSADGYAAKRCAEKISKYLNVARKHKWDWESIKTFLKYIPSYKFDDKWCSMERGSEHPKYISLEDFSSEIALCEKLFLKKAEFKFL